MRTYFITSDTGTRSVVLDQREFSTKQAAYDRMEELAMLAQSGNNLFSVGLDRFDEQICRIERKDGVIFEINLKVSNQEGE